MGLFMEAYPKKINILAIDVGTVSISAALVLASNGLKSEKEGYEVRKVLRYFFQLIDPASHAPKQRSEQITRVFLGGFNKLFSEIFKIEPKINKILISFADPFFSEKNITKKNGRENPKIKISKGEIDMVANAMAIEVKKETANSADLLLAGQEIISQAVNGYKISSAVGFRGKSLEIQILFTFLSKFLKDYVEESKEKFFPLSKIDYYSDIRVLWQILKSTENIFEQEIVVDIGGEMTGLFFADPGGITHVPAYSFGVRTLERRLAAFLKIDVIEAGAIMKKYASGTLDEALRIKVIKIFGVAMEDWWTLFQASLKGQKDIKNIILTGGGADFQIFAEAIKMNFKKYYDIEVKTTIIRAEAFRDFFKSLDALSGGSDVILTALILYAK